MSDPRSLSFAFSRAWRTLLRRPGTFVLAISSLAIALGLATAIIAEIDSLKHPYVAVPNPERLYTGYLSIERRGRGPRPIVPPEEVVRVLAASPAIEQAVPVADAYGGLDAGAYVGSANAMLAFPGSLQVIGVRPRIGRLFTATEGPASGVALVTDEFWKRYYGGRDSIGGATLTFSDVTYQIVGVIARGFEPVLGQAIVLPGPPHPQSVRRYMIRTKPGMDSLAARSAFAAASDRLTSQFGTGGIRFRIWAYAFRIDGLRLDTIHFALMGAALFIVIIACANVSALMLARGVANRRDQALRLALGARRSDLLRTVTAEVAILAALGGVVGSLVALASTGVLRAVIPPEMRFQGFVEPQWNPRVFAEMFVAIIGAIAIAAAAPAWYTSRIAPAEPLKDSSGTTTGRPTKRFQLLVVAELALALILLIGASLVGRTVSLVSTFDFGYDARHLSRIVGPIRVVDTLRVYAPNDPTNPRRTGITEISATELVDIVARVRALPSVRDAAWVTDDAAERDAVSSDATQTLDSIIFKPRVFNIGPGFMATLGLAIVAGRDFVDGDRTDGGAVILDQAAAHRLFPDSDAVGRMVKLGPPLSRTTPWVRVVGVVRNAVHALPDFPELPPPSVIYVTRLRKQFAPSIVFAAKRGTTDSRNLVVRTVRTSLHAATVIDGDNWARGYDEMLASRRFIGQIFATLGFASLVLAAAGLFGVLSYVVNQRMREFAVRVALGATRRNVLRLVARESFVMALGGTALGGLIGLSAGFALYDWLWGVYPIDATALVTAEVVLLAVTTLAGALPALRAARANPLDVMRAN